MSLFTATLGWVTRTQKKLKQCTTELQQNVEVMRKADDDTIWKERVKFQVASETMDLHYTRAQEYLDKLEVIVADLENDDPDKLRMDAIREEAMDVMDASSQLQTEVKMKFRGIEIALSERKKEATSKGQPAASIVTTTEELTTQQSTRMLPQIQIPTFSGKRWEFENFWTLFQTLIHQSSLVPLIKFTHLLNLLKGEPRTLLSCYQLTEENYTKALATLEARYSNEEVTVKDLSSKLQKAKLDNPSLRAQRDLFCTLKVVLEQLESRKEHVDTQITRELVLNKFPASIKKEVIKKKLESKEAWSMSTLLADLEGVLIMEEELATATKEDNQPKTHQQSSGHGGHQKPVHKESRPKPAVSSDKGFACVYCKKTGHSSKNCQEIKDTYKRTKILSNELRCFNCTNTSHSAKECPSKRSCDVCNKRHHTSIHGYGNNEATGGQQKTPTPTQSVTKAANKASYTPKQKPSTQATQNVASTRESNGLQLTEAIQCKAATQARGSYLPTVQAQAFDHNSKVWGPISIMLDTGADRTYISKDLATAWDLEKTEEIRLRIQTFGNESPETAEQFQTCNLWLKAENDPIQMKVVSAPKLTGQIPKAALTEEDLKWIQSNQITLNDESHDEKVAPDLIIGCDYLPSISQGQLIRLPSGISLIHTIFGYATLGRREDIGSDLPTLPPIEAEETFLSSVNMGPSEEDLQEIIARDQMTKEGNEFSGPEAEERAARDIETRRFFRETIERRGKGYYVRIPFKNDVIKRLPDNFAIAKKRLDGVLRKNNTEVLKMIDNIFQEQLEKKIIEIVENRHDSNGGDIHYNPHQPVITPQKTTTKCRVVFDGSAHFANEPSLNDAVLQGPVILPDSIGMLLRFRCGDTAMTSDVEKAFLQVFLHEEDRDVTRMLWVKDLSEPATGDNLVVFRSTRVFFGLNASPYLLGDTCIHHLESIEDQELAKQIVNNLYVDNLILTNDHSSEKNVELYKTLKSIFDDMGMNLREFVSNDQRFNENLAEKDRTKDEDQVKVLGIRWLPKKDQLELKCSMPELYTITKRTVASAIASIYDPMGLLVPLLLPFKLFQRELWKEDMDYEWDTPLSQTHEKQWLELVKQANGFTKFIPRMSTTFRSPDHLVTFCDASRDAISICIYMCSTYGAHIILAKSKIRPIKEVWTIPKMELHAIKFGMEQSVLTWKHFNDGGKRIHSIHVMSDNKAALDWIKSQPGKKEAGVFVYNRIRAIREMSEDLRIQHVPTLFGYVDTHENPADLGTRGLDATHFHEDRKWFHGPDFIKKMPSDWNKKNKTNFLPATQEEASRIFVARHVETERQTIFDSEKRTNNYDKMIRVVAYTLRAIKKFAKRLDPTKQARLDKSLLRSVTNNDVIGTEEFDSAENLFLKEHQSNLNINKQAWKNLFLKVDYETNLIVCEGRWKNSDLEQPAKTPIFIIPKSHVAKMLLLKAHGKWHKAVDHTMATVRSRFWIPQLRQQTKQLVGRCVRCQRFNKAPYRYPDMTALPSKRVKKARPFEHIGLDYFGPINYRDLDGSIAKAFGCVFTCSVTRLVHIEPVFRDDTTAFLMAVRRFVATRGLPTSIVSDNAPIFILADKILSDLQKQDSQQLSFEKDIQQFFANNSIEWSFITPYAPWQGGMYERLMRSIKGALRKAIGRTILTSEELATSLIEIAGMLNSRPLTYIGDDIHSGRPLCPNDFISATMTVTLPLAPIDEMEDEWVPPKEDADTKRNTIRALYASVAAVEEAWTTFHTLYTAELREKHKVRMDAKKGVRNHPKRGTIVLICDPNHPRNYWRLGQITDVNTSSDGEIREVSIRTENGRYIRRPTNLVTPLEIDEEAETEEEEPPTEPTHNPYDLPWLRTETSEQTVDKPENPPTPEAPSTIPTTPAVTPSLEPHPSGYALRRRTQRSYAEVVASMLLIIAALFTTAAGQLPIVCTNTGVQLRHQFDRFEVCSKDYCTSRPRLQWHNSDTTDIWLPPAIKVAQHHVTAKSILGKDLSTFEVDCPAVSACQTIDCTLCITNLVNPECHPKFAIAALAITIYILLLLAHCCVKAMRAQITVGAPIKLGFNLIQKAASGTRNVVRNIIGGNTQRRPSGFKWEKLIPILMCIAISQACHEVNMLSDEAKVCVEGTSECHLVTNSFLTINQFKKEACIRLARNSTTTKEIRITFEAVQLDCNKETVTTTKDIQLKVWSVKRCPRTGSCTPTKCTEITRNSTIPELDQVNHLKGVTACSESCGGPGCGCFYLSSGCLFYRIYAEQRSFDTFEIFKCTEWAEKVRMRLTVTELASEIPTARQYNLTAPLSLPETQDGITVTVESLHTPNSPILNTWFVRNRKAIATWEEHLLPTIQCPRMNSTIHECEFQEECTCTPAEDEMKCTCRDESISNRFNSLTHRLPLAEAHWRLKRKEQTVEAEIKDATSVRLAISVKEKLETIIVQSREKCDIQAEQIIGCYGCNTGGTSEVTCTSTTHETIGNIVCQEDMFTVPCSTTGTKSTITFFADTAKFLRSCSISCGDESKEFEITGILKYTGSVWTSLYRMVEGNTTLIHEINLPDFGHLIDGYLTFMKSVASAIIVALIAFAITGAIITSFFLMGTKRSIRLTIKLIRLPFRILGKLYFFCWRLFRPTKRKHTRHTV